MPKMDFNRGTLVSATAIYQTRCPFTVLSALFLFFRTLPYDSRLFPGEPLTMILARNWPSIPQKGFTIIIIIHHHHHLFLLNICERPLLSLTNSTLS